MRAESRLLAGVLLLTSALGGPSAAFAQARLTVVNGDAPGTGFNDTTPRTPEGGNPATTLGTQRLLAFRRAAGIWAGLIDSDVEIRVLASFAPLACSSTSAVLGAAGTRFVLRDFPGAPFANTWYGAALADRLAGTELLDPGTAHIGATFNLQLDGDCAFPQRWYYGLDSRPGPAEIDFVSVVLHELTHGLGFQTFVDVDTGARLQNRNDAYMRFLFDRSQGPWPELTDAGRRASIVNSGNLLWSGSWVGRFTTGLGFVSGFDVRNALDSDFAWMFAPNPVQRGSSVSHWDTTLTPPELMRHTYQGANHTPTLSWYLLHDLGWFGQEGPPFP